MVRIAFLEIRLEFHPQPARLWPKPFLKSGFPFSSIQSKRARQMWLAGKPVFMSIDLAQYRRIAAEHGEEHLYTDDALLRLYAVLPRKALAACPHLFSKDEPDAPTAETTLALHYQETPDTPDKEASP
jgi:hypothetical protein